jgi:hypothetical protein
MLEHDGRETDEQMLLEAVLADPTVMALMATDRVDRDGFENLLRRMVVSLSQRDPPDRSERFASRARRSGNSSATVSSTGSFVSTASSSQNPAMEILP